jgi:hypothetical protein
MLVAFIRIGELAQLVERLHGMQEVSGSTPLFSTYNSFIFIEAVSFSTNT